MRLPLCLSVGLFLPLLPCQDVNVALGGTATQTSISGFGEQPGYAIDGNRDGNWWSYSSTCTANTPNQMWQVVLAAPSVVNEVVIYNRADGWGERLSNFRLRLRLGNSTVHVQDFFTHGGHPPNGGRVRAVIGGSVTADTVQLQNLGLNAEGNYYLQFAEVEVIRYGAAREVELARHGTATQSSTDGSHAAARAVDGRTDGFVSNGSVARTTNTAGAWWQVTFPRARVDQIRLWPGTTGAVGMGNIRVAVFDGATQVWSQSLLPSGMLARDRATLVTPAAGTTGDRVRITSLGPNASGWHHVELAEVEVLHFGNALGTERDFGAACPGTAGLPKLTAQSRPLLGTTFTTVVDNVPANPGAAFLVTGLSNTQWGATPLPVWLIGMGAPGCFGYVSVDTWQFASATQGSASFALPIPLLTITVGLQLFQQAMVLDPTANGLGLTTSNALRVVTGH